MEGDLPHGRKLEIKVAMGYADTTTWQKAPNSYTSASYPFLKKASLKRKFHIH